MQNTNLIARLTGNGKTFELGVSGVEIPNWTEAKKFMTGSGTSYVDVMSKEMTITLKACSYGDLQNGNFQSLLGTNLNNASPITISIFNPKENQDITPDHIKGKQFFVESPSIGTVRGSNRSDTVDVVLCPVNGVNFNSVR